jgi:hypothetical protein
VDPDEQTFAAGIGMSQSATSGHMRCNKTYSTTSSRASEKGGRDLKTKRSLGLEIDGEKNLA